MRTLATSSIVVVFLVFGCTGGEGQTPSGEDSENAAETPSEGGSENATVTNATKALGEAVTAVKALAREKVEQFQRTMENRLAAINRQIEELQAEAVAAGKDEYKEQVQALAEKRDALQKKLDELGSTTADAWDDVKTGLGAAYEDLEKAVREAAARFADDADDAAKTSESGGEGKQG